jgi:phenylpropionate dioxygenase-like ring-hydroxylating dioxygenase large terminal subunit
MIGMTLPAWTYTDPGFLALEREAIFLRTWQLAGHISELPRAGDYLRFDLLDQSAIVLRGEDGALRAFHNVCRHRAFRLLDGPHGQCGRAIRCRYHGFTYDLQGSLKQVPGEADFDGLDKDRHGLKPVETEIFLGLIFLRFGGDGPSIAQQFAPYRAALELYRIPEMQPVGTPWSAEIRANWKVAVDNNIEGYHIAMAHPGLQRLYGPNYRFETRPLGVSHAGGRLVERPSANWSERHYQKLLPDVGHLPEERKRAWLYYAMFPNLAFDIYPDMIDYFQILPVSHDRSRSRLRSFALPDDRREMRAARYLNQRINAQVGREDVALVEGVQAGLGSLGYGAGPLSGKEARVRQFHDMIRAAIPAANAERVEA